MYRVKFYDGDYRQRQMQANLDKCIAYVEHHFNSSSSPDAKYSVVIVGSNASQVSKNWGRNYASEVAQAFNSSIGGDKGILVGGFEGRGDGNLRYTNMPAILLEPLFCSNPEQAEIIKSEEGQEKLARILCNSITNFFPVGGLVGFSVGHKYKPNGSTDKGASIVGGGWEADYAEMVLKKAALMLSEINPHSSTSDDITDIGYSKDWMKYFFGFAKHAASRSSCLRRKVGAVLIKDKRIISTGYNGAPSKVISCKETGVCIREKLKIPSGERHEMCHANGSHGELNAITQCAKHGVSAEGSEMFCTTAPCSMCIAAMINSGIRKVYYLEGYFNPMVDIVSDHPYFKTYKIDEEWLNS